MMRIQPLRIAQSIALSLPFITCAAFLGIIDARMMLSFSVLGLGLCAANLLFGSFLLPFRTYFARYIDPATKIVLSALIGFGYVAILFPLGILNPVARRRFRSSRMVDADSYWERPRKV